jgi:uroporphyrinogen decarboxylase
MGLGLYFTEGEGPRFRKPVRHADDVAALSVPDPEDKLGYVMDTIRLLRRELAGRIPLIGFAGSPWTLATYMVEGGGSKDFHIVKSMMFDHPELMHRLLGILADAVTAYLNAQITAGAQALMIFDTWGGILTPRDYREFSLRYMADIVHGLISEDKTGRVPVILFTKNGGQWLEAMATCGCDAVGIDWTTDLHDARTRVGDKVALQGNMDPALLYASPQRIQEEVGTILKSYGPGSGLVFNLGHGIQQGVEPERLSVLIDAVHAQSKPYHVSE